MKIAEQLSFLSIMFRVALLAGGLAVRRAHLFPGIQQTLRNRKSVALFACFNNALSGISTLRSTATSAAAGIEQSEADESSSWETDDDEPASLLTPPLPSMVLPTTEQLSRAGEQRTNSNKIMASIVKVFSVMSSPNYILPWQNKPMKEVTGSGFAIAGKRIMTNAHVVADEKYITVRKLGSPIKYHATVIAAGHECDLAVLSVADESFWEGVKELPFGQLPELQDEVTVIGYPIGGDNVSFTRGVVSRIEPQQYAHCSAHLLAIQIDAAINPGNSGGPVMKGNEVCGVSFQNLYGASNIGFIIPGPIIEHFLEDVHRNRNDILANGRAKYDGFCTIGLFCQSIENKALRSHLGMDRHPGLDGKVSNS